MPEPVDFVDLAQFVRKALAPIAEGKDVRLTCSVAPNVPLSMADWEKLRRIVENLVDNAIKFCGEPMSLPNDLDLLVEEFDKRGIRTEA